MPKDYLDEIHGHLQKFGGSRKVENYAVVNYGPLLRHLTIVKRNDGKGEMCLCGKEKLINVEYIQLRNDSTAPLLQVGSKCVKRFILKDDKSKTSRVCFTCRNPLRSIMESEHKLCRVNRAIKEADEKRRSEVAERLRDESERQDELEEMRRMREEDLLIRQQEEIKQSADVVKASKQKEANKFVDCVKCGDKTEEKFMKRRGGLCQMCFISEW